MLNICLLPVNIIVQRTSILFPSPFLTAFPFIFTAAILLTSSLRKKDTIFANLLLFSSIKCPAALSLFITATTYLPSALSGSIWHCKTSPVIGVHVLRYKLKDIFNAYEFGLFFQALPYYQTKHLN